MTVTTVVQNVNPRKTSVVLGDAEKVLYGKGYILDTLCGKTYALSPRSFYQINHSQTEVLYGLAVEAAHLTGKEVVLDAYCGIGTIGLTAADHAKQVVGVELNRDAVQDASGQQYKLVSREEPHAAQISLVMGSDHDRWQDNLRLAVAVEERLMQSYPTLMRPITLRNYSYNQSVCPGSMLVEVGAAGNSLDEAIYAARLFAAGLAETITA